MKSRSPVVLLPIVIGLVLALTSCGFLSFKSSEPEGCPASGAGMCVTLETVGDTFTKGTIFVPRPGADPAASCATWVKGEGGNPGRISLPSAFDKTVGGRTVRFGSHIIGYTGPRAYEGGDAIRSGNDGSLSIVVNSRTYSAARALVGRVTAEVRADGSGSVTFVNLVENPKPKGKSSRQVNGSYTWTCQD